MKLQYKLLLFSAIILFSLASVNGNEILPERHGKYQSLDANLHIGKLNFQRVLSQWNKSSSEHGISQQSRAVEKNESNESGKISDLQSFMDRFSSGFKKCIFTHKKQIIENISKGKNIIFKCFRVELLRKLQDVIDESESVSLLKGYVELVKIDRYRKDHGNEKARKAEKLRDEQERTEKAEFLNREERRRTKREIYGNDTIFSRSSRQLIHEIVENFERDEEEEKNLKGSMINEDFIFVLNDLMRKFALRFNLLPGVAARMKLTRSTGVTFDLELDDLTGFGDDDEEDDDDNSGEKEAGVKDAKGGEKSEEEEDVEEDEEDEGQRQGKGKGKDKKKKIQKKKMKMLKKLIPYLLIPMMIQAVMLPIAFKFLLFFAIKALLAGKIALLLVAINLIKNVQYKSDEDEYIERVGQEHYGYGRGEEYGAWVNRRSYRVEKDQAREIHPYRAYAPVPEAR